MDPQTFDDIISDIVTAIYNSRVIPESHKEKYVEHLQKNGMTEKMMDELEKIFAEEEKTIALEIEDQQQLVASLEEVIKQEQQENDEQQAEIMAVIDQYGTEGEKTATAELEDLSQVFEKSAEEVIKGDEEAQIEALKSKIKKQ